MRNTLAICQKDVRIYLTTWTSYVLFAAFTLMSAFFFQRLVIEYQMRTLQMVQMRAGDALEQLNLIDYVMAPLFLNITVFLLFLLPIMTMRLMAEERRQKTLELLMTTPLRSVEIVIGKFLSGVVIMTIMLALTVSFPVLLNIFSLAGPSGSALDYTTLLASYIGMFLLGASFVAVGLFASSLSESQIVAVITGFATLLMLYVIGLAARGQEGWAEVVFSNLSINTHLEGFVHGVVRTTDVAYFVSVTFVALFLSHQIIEAQRWR